MPDGKSTFRTSDAFVVAHASKSALLRVSGESNPGPAGAFVRVDPGRGVSWNLIWSFALKSSRTLSPLVIVALTMPSNSVVVGPGASVYVGGERQDYVGDALRPLCGRLPCARSEHTRDDDEM